MNKTEFIKVYAETNNIKQAEATKNLNAVLKCIVQSLKANDILKFKGFGIFKVKNIKAKEITTPRGQTVKVLAHKRPAFSTSETFKRIVNTPQKENKRRR